MSKSLLVVDPLPTQRRLFCDAVAPRMLAYAIANSGDLPNNEVFDVYWVSLRQASGHGLQLGRELKGRFPRAQVVVYGKPDGRGTTQRGKVEQLWGVDLFIPFTPDPADVVMIVRSLLRGTPVDLREPPTEMSFTAKGQTPPRVPSIPPSAGARPIAPPVGMPAASPLLTPSRPPESPAPVREERTDDEPSWTELFTAPLSLDTMSQILRKDLFGRRQRTA